MAETSYSKLVDGYKRAFIDSSVEAEPAYTPQFISNYRGNKVLTQLENELRECSSMFISVAFITGGGIAHLKGVLKEMEAKNVPGRILTTDYLLFSEPAALDALAGLNNLEVRMFRTSGVGFHTKGYLFHNGNDIRIIVGSSNLTQNAITRNFEWNTRVVSTSDGQYAKDIEAEFNSVWESSVDYNSCREEYERQYQEAKSQKAALTKIVTSLDMSYSKVISPNTMQKGFMSEIERLIKAGESRALLVSATGTGKTYASAFAVRGVFANELIHKKKVLFLSHSDIPLEISLPFVVNFASKLNEPVFVVFRKTFFVYKSLRFNKLATIFYQKAIYFYLLIVMIFLKIACFNGNRHYLCSRKLKTKPPSP